jgi:uncharacterized protein (TIGR04255 family)
VFDVRVVGGMSVEQLTEFSEQYGREQGLTKITPIRAGMFGVSITPGQPFATHAEDKGVIGFRLEDEPATKIVQFRKDGVTFSHVGQYDEWAKFRDRALKPTAAFLACPGIVKISRVALRYINVIRFPMTRVALEEYLPGAPIVPQGLPQIIAGFFSRLVLPIPEDGLVAVITQALEEPAQPTPSVILDIDVFREVGLEPADRSWQQMFEKIREWKNRIFFEFVNENTVSLYK